MFPLIDDSVNEMVQILEEKSGTELDIYETYKGLTLDVISRCALALKLDCQRNPKVFHSIDYF